MSLLIGLGEGDGSVEVRWQLKLDFSVKTIEQPCCVQKPLLGINGSLLWDMCARNLLV